MQIHWLPKGITFAVFAAVGLCAVYWGGKAWSSSQPVQLAHPAVAPVTSTGALDHAAVLKALGGVGASGGAAPASARFVLKGIAATAQGGAALIAVDGQAARPYLTGQVVQAPYVLGSLGQRHAVLQAQKGAAAELRLELPPAEGSGSARR